MATTNVFKIRWILCPSKSGMVSELRNSQLRNFQKINYLTLSLWSTFIDYEMDFLTLFDRSTEFKIVVQGYMFCYIPISCPQHLNLVNLSANSTLFTQYCTFPVQSQNDCQWRFRRLDEIKVFRTGRWSVPHLHFIESVKNRQMSHQL